MRYFIKPVLNFWNRKNLKDKNLFIGVGIVIFTLTLSAVWLIAIIHQRQKISQQLPEIRNQVARAAELSHQISLLADVPDQQPDISLDVLQKNLIAVGLNPLKIIFDKKNIVLKFENIAFSNLIKWSYDAQINFQLVVVEAIISPLDKIDQVDATLTFKKLM